MSRTFLYTSIATTTIYRIFYFYHFRLTFKYEMD